MYRRCAFCMWISGTGRTDRIGLWSCLGECLFGASLRQTRIVVGVLTCVDVVVTSSLLLGVCRWKLVSVVRWLLEVATG